MPSTTVRPGAVLAGKFRVDSVVGVGGMGMVVAAHHLALDRRVALKLMLPKVEGRDDLSARFLREARAAARLQGEHVTRVLDVGTLDDGAPYIVMELLDGVDLATVLRRTGRVPVATAAGLVIQAARAVAEAHAAGIVHRDLKPANLFVTRRRDGGAHVKVLDLGVCKLLQPDADLIGTSTATVIGTPAYMAPEQMRSAKQADARSDIWSLGVILYELVCGRLPFSGQTYAEVCLRAALDPCPPLDVDVPGGFGDVVARCLDKDPDRRLQTVDELIDALAPHAGAVDLPSVAHRRSAGIEPTVAASLPAASVHPTPVPRRGWRIGAAVLAVAAIAGAASALAGHSAPAALEVPVVPLATDAVRVVAPAPPISSAVAPPQAVIAPVATPVEPSAARSRSRPRRRARPVRVAPEPAPPPDPLATPD